MEQDLQESPDHFCLTTLVVLAACAGLSGCGDASPRTYPVRGKVVFADGTPLSTGGVVLSESASDGSAAVNARGAIAPDGTFELTTFNPGDGAVPGKHRVLVRAQRDPTIFLEHGIPPKPVIDPRLEQYDTSELQFTVEEKSNDLTIEVRRPAR